MVCPTPGQCPWTMRSPTAWAAGDHFAGGLVRALLLQYALQGAVASQILNRPERQR